MGARALRRDMVRTITSSRSTRWTGPIDLEPGATIDDLRSAIDGHIRATATLMGVYER